jgi:hypothetical protein
MFVLILFLMINVPNWFLRLRVGCLRVRSEMGRGTGTGSSKRIRWWYIYTIR